MTDDTQNTEQQDDDTSNNDNNDTTTSSHESVNWEARYKSLQAVQEKKRQKLEQQIYDLTTKNEQAILEFNEKKNAIETFERQQAQFLKEKADLEEKLRAEQLERDNLNKKVLFQKVILAEFSDLSDMIDYVPKGETEEEIRANAIAFREKAKKYVDAGVKKVLEGSSSTASGTGNTMPTTSEEDALWKRIYNSAGITGKEEEFAKANKDLQDFLARKSKQ